MAIMNNNKVEATVKPHISPVQLYGLNLMKFGKNFSSANHEFCVQLPDDIANQMAAAGWRVKWTNPSERYPISQAYINVKASWRFFTPQIVYVRNGAGVTSYDEAHIGQLDKLDIHNINLILTGSSKKPDDDGVWRFSAYVSEMTFEVRPHVINRDGSIPAMVCSASVE